MGGGGAAQGEGEDLPQANVKRVVKTKLQELALGHYGEERDVSVNKDALLAFSESAKIFIHFLSATANEICRESKRQTVNADDVLKAVEELDFPEFSEPLMRCLAAFRKDQEAKKQDKRKSSGASTPRKRKSDGNFVDDNPAANEDYEDGVAMADDDDTTDN
ncbi:DNA polymerase II subunit B4 [Physcomitrium patens]|uniref:Transcription factor CBF/NF-Y/archaeal histone domain-containing protein n=1 Tax=Physcomitrium patens TaxID=3218 RepID=A9TF10_PHYPA|nr:DNA polymerase epsilon subunit 3-like [Physcomitrium patens]XP_024366137.1 DNA polymerase epsilon subunit 3-like [Physcomitrium patens]PNR26909.1 hypothetical protein PHYPA_030390 [Physcomitrium patens]|eukprot:XP_024366136.1 DNA polymerase epsilon subunit 3-like [Physcomitrella patens]